MHCIVTAGPTYEPLDNVRRLTNFSSGRLGSELATFLTRRGHKVTLLLGQQATFRGEREAEWLETFSTTANLRDHFQALARQPRQPVGGIFHAAAVSDFSFGAVWLRSPEGELTPIKSGKISTRLGTLLAELVPTPKIISELRDWFPQARIVGWKFEVDGDRAGVIALARRQLAECKTDACVTNGPAYGLGFGLVKPTGESAHHRENKSLFEALEGSLR
jgi:phosphopantothenoylcysteine synthetase/decarboxylase